MKKPGDKRSRAETAFLRYWELERAGQAPLVDDYVARNPAELRDELRRMIDDYRALRESTTALAGALSAGRCLGDFRLTRELGRGGMAVVWEAEQLSLRRRVALKVLAHHYAPSEQAVRRFEREARAGGRLAHPGIVQTYGIGTAEQFHFIVQELVPGSYTLADAIADLRTEAALPPGYYRGVARLFAKLAEATEYAHSKGVIHRDLKPGNILLTETDEPRIADFGLARIQDELGLSRTGSMEGTPFYMSPEQASMRAMGLDHRTDIFSLGATLYEALTLTRAFEGDTSQHVFRKILTIDPPEPRTVRASIPRDLEVVCMKCLEKDPGRRYSRAAELAADLDRYLTDEPIRAKPPTSFDRVVKWARRSPARAAGAVVTALSLVVISGLAVHSMRVARISHANYIRAEDQRQRADRSAIIARRSSYNASIQGAAAVLDAGSVGLAAGLLDACPPEERRWEWHHLRLRLDGSARLIATGDEPIRSLACLPDGDRFLVGRRDGSVQLWTLDGRLIRAFVGHRDAVDCLDVDPAGQSFLSGSGEGTIRVWDLDSGLCTVAFGSKHSYTQPSGDSSLASSKRTRTGFLDYLDSLGIWADVPAVSMDGSLLVSRHSGETSEDDVLLLWSVADRRVVSRLKEEAATIAFGPRARYLAVGTYSGELVVLDSLSGDECARAKLLNEPVELLAVDPLGRYVAVGYDGADSLILYPLNENETTSTHGHAYWGIDVFAFDPTGRFLGVGDMSGEVWLLDLSRDSLQSIGQADENYWGGIDSLAFSPDGGTLAASFGSGRVTTWRSTTGERLKAWRAHSGESIIEFDSDGRVVTDLEGDPLRLWRAATGEMLLEVNAHEAWLSHALFGPGDSVLTVCGRGIIRSWDKTSGALLDMTATPPSHRGLHLLRDEAGRMIAWEGGSPVPVRAESPSARFCDAVSGEEIRVVPLSSMPGVEAFVCRDGASADLERFVELNFGRAPAEATLLDEEGTAIARLGGGWPGVVRFAPSGDLLALAFDNALYICDSTAGGRLGVAVGHRAEVSDVVFTPDAGTLVSGDTEGDVRVWALPVGQPRQTLLVGNARSGGTVGFSPDGRTLAVADSMTGQIRLWDASTGHPIGLFQEPDEEVLWLRLLFLSDASLASSSPGGVTVRDLPTGRVERYLTGPAEEPRALARDHRRERIVAGTGYAVWSWEPGVTAGRRAPDWFPWIQEICYASASDCFLVGCAEGSIRVLDGASLEVLTRLDAHNESVAHLAPADPVGKFVSGSEDGTVKVWEPGSDEALYTARETEPIEALTVSPDGMRVAWATNSKVRIARTDGLDLLLTLDPNREGEFVGTGSRSEPNEQGGVDYGRIESLAFRPDGGRLAAVGGRLSVEAIVARGSLFVVSAVGGRLSVVWSRSHDARKRSAD